MVQATLRMICSAKEDYGMVMAIFLTMAIIVEAVMLLPILGMGLIHGATVAMFGLIPKMIYILR